MHLCVKWIYDGFMFHVQKEQTRDACHFEWCWTVDTKCEWGHHMESDNESQINNTPDRLIITCPHCGAKITGY
jgi:hypothetical protein